MKQARSDVTFQQGSIKSHHTNIFASQWLISTAFSRLFKLLSLSSSESVFFFFLISKLTTRILVLKFCIIKLPLKIEFKAFTSTEFNIISKYTHVTDPWVHDPKEGL